MDTLKILVVDDESRMRKLVKDFLTKKNFQVLEAGDGEEAMDIFYKEKDIALIILDVMMPKMNGFDVCKNLRKAKPDIPVLLLTAKGTITDKTQGFDCGADDYLVKPFDIQEVLLRVKALLRRNTDNSSKDEQSFKQEILKMGDIELFPESLETGIEGKRIKLTPTEFEILYCLMQHFNDSVSLAVLLDEVWGYDSDEDVRMVRVHVGGLRQKIEADTKNPKYLHTVTNVGYKLTPITNTTDNGQE